MSSGPTREELQKYWTYNRQYFETLAKYYAETDKEYYRNYISPFYGTFRQKTGKPKLVILIAAFVLFLGIGAAVSFFLIIQESSDKVISPPKTIESDTTLDRMRRDTTVNRLLKDSTFRRLLSPEIEKQLLPKGKTR
jgi:hypothetical protein